MRPRRHSCARTPHAGGALMAALFALLVQLMAPSVMAAELGRGETMVICTVMGVQTVQAPTSGTGEDGKAALGGLPCLDCLAPAHAALPAPVLPVLSVAYAVGRIEHAPAARFVVPPARAPPRPPGQGPPASDI